LSRQATTLATRTAPAAVAPPTPAGAVAREAETTGLPRYLRRACACGGAAGGCDDCRPLRLQRRGRAAIADAQANALEVEADRVANQVLDPPRAPGPRGATSVIAPAIQRLATSGAPAAPLHDTALPASVRGTLASPGRALPEALRHDMGRRFGHDFSAVRIHDGPQAAQSASDVNAQAYTIGHHLVFGAGHFAPHSHEGRHLLAHELTHVVQQGAAAPRLQRKPAHEDDLSIVGIVTFETAAGEQAPAEAHLSDGSVEPVVVKDNRLAPGTYSLEHVGSGEYVGAGNRFIWIKKASYGWAQTVTVTVIAGDRRALDARIDALPAPIRGFLTTGSGSGRVSLADLDSVAQAGKILDDAGVSGDELALQDLRVDEARDFGRQVTPTDDNVGWARRFVAERQQAREAALQTRTELTGAAKRLDTLSADDKAGLHNIGDGVVLPQYDNEETLEKILHGRGLLYQPLMKSFERELQSFTLAFLAQSQLVLRRLEQTYLAGRNVGVEKRRLAEVLGKVRPAVQQRDAAKEERDRRLARKAVNPGCGGPKCDLEGAEASLDASDEALRAQSQAAGFDVAAWKPFDLDIVRTTDVDKSRGMLGQFVAKFRATLQSAEQRAQDVKTLYKADRMIAFTKASIGVTQGSAMDDLINARVRLQPGDGGFWSTVWNVVTFALMFVPGNVGILLRVGAGLVDAGNALKDYADTQQQYQTGQSSNAPSALGVVVAVGGVLVDVPQLGRELSQVARIEGRSVAGSARAADLAAAHELESAAARGVTGAERKMSTELTEEATTALSRHKPLAAGGHEFHVLKDGRVMRCSALCGPVDEALMLDFADVLHVDPHTAELDHLRGLMKTDPEAAVKYGAELQDRMARLRATVDQRRTLARGLATADESGRQAAQSLAAADTELATARKRLATAEGDLQAALELRGEVGRVGPAHAYVAEARAAVDEARRPMAALEQSQLAARAQQVEVTRARAELHRLEGEVAALDARMASTLDPPGGFTKDQWQAGRRRNIRPTRDQPGAAAYYELEAKKEKALRSIESETENLSRRIDDQVRAATPGKVGRPAALKNAAALPPPLRPKNGVPIDVTTGQPMTTTDWATDHIMARSEIARDPRFARLTPQQRDSMLLDVPENYLPITGSANSSKKGLSVKDWIAARERNHIALPKEMADALLVADARAREAVDAMFKRFLSTP